MPTAQSRRDLNRKLRFEAQLRPKLRKYQNKIVREFRARLRRDGTALNINEFNQELTDILDAHYRRVGQVFSNNMSLRLPNDVVITDAERATILAALTAWYLTVVPASARRISQTTGGNMIDSIDEASQDELVLAQRGREAQLTMAALAAALLDRKLRGRENSIIMTETQRSAEVAKATEAEVLSGAQPSISAPGRRELPVTKEWVTVGDSLVRPPHVAADGQTVTLNQPYEVGGEFLMYPGDPNLGASTENIINCRCSSEYDKSEIVILRRPA